MDCRRAAITSLNFTTPIGKDLREKALDIGILGRLILIQ
jgi:hypothetical protein